MTIRIMVIMAIVILTAQIIFLQGHLGRLERMTDELFVSPHSLFQNHYYEYKNNSGITDNHPAHNVAGAIRTAQKTKTKTETKTDVTFSISDILHKAGVDLTPEIQSKLPSSEEDVVRLYGSKPIIKGLSRCAAFRDSVPAISRMLAPAGMFNTGTNLVNQLLRENCYIPERIEKLGKESPGMRRQVPWGKHSPASWRFKHKAAEAGDIKHQDYVLPVVVIKDPYTWMTSMCRHSYSTNWLHSPNHCPNLVVLDKDAILKKTIGEGNPVPVNVHYTDDNITHHESLVGLWNDYYSGWYMDASFPRVIVRFEDLLFHAEEVITEVCHCGGGEMTENFTYIAESAKTGDVHAGALGLIQSISRYGNSTLRFEPYTHDDLEYATNELDVDLLIDFRYDDDEVENILQQ